MSDKLKKIYEALVDGAEDGLEGAALFKHVVDECPKATSKKIVKASLLALSDKDLKDEKVLRAIYDLAIRHRLDPVAADDHDEEEAPKATRAPELKGRKKKAKTEVVEADAPAAD